MLALLLLAGCAAGHHAARIAPQDWEAVTSRTYPVSRDRSFTAVLRYVHTVGTVIGAERATGRIEARIGVPPSDPRTVLAEMATFPVYEYTVSEQGRRSSRVSLRIMNPQLHKKGGASLVVETARLPYSASLDSIGVLLSAPSGRR